MAKKKAVAAKAKAGTGNGKKPGSNPPGGGAQRVSAAAIAPSVKSCAPLLALLGDVADDAEIVEFFAEECASQLALALSGAAAGATSPDAVKLDKAIDCIAEFLTDYELEADVPPIEEALRAVLRQVLGDSKSGAADDDEDDDSNKGDKNAAAAADSDDDGSDDGEDGDEGAATMGGKSGKKGGAMSNSAKKKAKREAKKGKQVAKAADIKARAEDGGASASLVDGAPRRAKGFVSILDSRRKGLETQSNDIHVEKFDLGFNRNMLFRNANLSLINGRKYGLVAPNGLGKSTLLRAVAARENEFENIPSHFDIHYCEQEVVADDTPALQRVIQADTERIRLLEEEKMMMEDDELYDGDLLIRIHERLDQIEADSAEARASAILTGLQFTEEMKQQPTKDFSGGWRMRIALACSLFRRPTLLLLDEPTNHLDLLAVIWLDNYLTKWKRTLLIVSHDQDFLNSVCTDIIHIEDQLLHYYKGSYDKFKLGHAEKMKAEQKAWDQYEKALRAEKLARGKKDNKNADVNKAQKTTKRIADKAAAGRGGKGGKKGGEEEKSSAESALVAPKRPLEYRVHFDFQEPSELSIPIIQVKDAGFQYSDKRVLFEQLDFGIDQQSRISLVGPNGAGKTTLLKLIWGELQPTYGEINVNRHLIVGKYSQHAHEQLQMDLTPIEYLMKRFPDLPELQGKGQQQIQQFMRSKLGRFGLAGETHTRTIGSLSGGQKARVCLVEVSLLNPHVLFFDEPTNHLDIESIDALIDALKAFEGGVIVVSHDARLITELDCDLWIIPGDKHVIQYAGGFEDYRDELIDKFEAHEAAMEEARLAQQDERRQKREAERAAREKQMAEVGRLRAEKAGSGETAVASPDAKAGSKKGGSNEPAPKAAGKPSPKNGKGGKKSADLSDDDDDEDDMPIPMAGKGKKGGPKKASPMPKKPGKKGGRDSDDDEVMPMPVPKKKGGRNRNAVSSDDDEPMAMPVPKKKGGRNRDMSSDEDIPKPAVKGKNTGKKK